MQKLLILAVGSILGGFSRYFLAGFIYEKFGTTFPIGTLIVNLTACFLVGFFSAIIDQKFFLGPNFRILLMTGFCGAYSTFSTYMLETSNLVHDGEFTRAFANIIISTVVGFIALLMGIFIGEII
ncbi:MAG: fluoride efflux transporter CrcB [Candidatus Omnitrophica bacterium]|nr:fluoride efflux transporter CrcB [Candidatus Omnitrophota bacterium]